MGLFDWLFGASKKKEQLKEMLTKGAVIIDVRSKGEFASGHVKNSTNIPLDNISANITKIKGLGKPIILCCASGMRSGSATRILKSSGITDVMNAGSWYTLNNL